jgi:hypothetical protein
MGQKKDQHGHLLEVSDTLKFLHNKICHFPTAMGSYVTLVISMCLLISFQSRHSLLACEQASWYRPTAQRRCVPDNESSVPTMFAATTYT